AAIVAAASETAAVTNAVTAALLRYVIGVLPWLSRLRATPRSTGRLRPRPSQGWATFMPCALALKRGPLPAPFDAVAKEARPTRVRQLPQSDTSARGARQARRRATARPRKEPDAVAAPDTRDVPPLLHDVADRAAVDPPDRGRDEGGEVRCQEDDDVGDLL